jgi:hypothetical protein
MEKNTVKLTNGEFLLLYRICDQKNAVAHEIDHLPEELSTQLGTAAGPVFPITLNGLIRRKLIRSSGIPEQDRGSLAGKLATTSAGRKLLQQEILAALAAARERDCRFDLALAASTLVPTHEVISALKKRKSCLIELAARLQAHLAAQANDEQPIHVQTLLAHPLSVIQCEINFMDRLIQALSATLPTAPPADEPVSCTVTHRNENRIWYVIVAFSEMIFR